MKYIDHLMTYYKALHRAHLPVDFARIDDDLSQYRLLIAPLWFLTAPSENEKLTSYVQNGGTLVLTMRSGIKDQENLCLTDMPLPGGLDDLAGIEVDEYDCLRDAAGELLWDGISYSSSKWCDIMHTTTAQMVAFWNSGYYANTPAITRNTFGQGKVWYVGTEMSEQLAAQLINALSDDAALKPLGQGDIGVELVKRTQNGKSWLFALNHTGEEKQLCIPEGWHCIWGREGNKLSAYEIRLYECGIMES